MMIVHSNRAQRALLPAALLACAFGAGASAHSTNTNAEASSLANFAEIRVPGKASIARVWEQDGVPHYSLSFNGTTFSEPKATNYDLLLRYRRFDPTDAQPGIPSDYRAGVQNRLMIVQYWTQGIEDYRATIREMGGEIHFFLANHSNVVEMDAATREAVEALPFVRSVTPFHPVYKLEDQLVHEIGNNATGEITVNLLTTRRSGHAPVIQWVENNGGEVVHVSQPTHLMTVTLPQAKLSGLAHLNSVKCIDRWTAPENDVDIARQLHGANLIEEVGGYDGTGVSGEVLDSGTDTAHPDFSTLVLHNQLGPGNHGTCVAGIVFGNGLGGNPRARGFAPNGRLIVARYLDPYSGGSRYNHSGELVDPALNYKAVFQTNSWGGGRTLSYNSQSAEIDMILFDFDHLTITQSQSNAGNQQSRPQAWGKNIVSVGALNHFGTLTPRDDRWNFGASIGPAADGRIKPDLASFYDRTLASDRLGNLGYSRGDWYENFGGTSGATPLTAGCFALFYQMWGDGIFGNAAGGTVFQDAPNNTTAKAFMVNSGSMWRFEGVNHDATRTHQGWGRADVRTVLRTANDYMWVDETDPVGNLQTNSYQYTVNAGDRQLRATMVYRDPSGTTSSSLHRINNLDLKLTSPSGTVFWGNNGMLAQPFTQPGGGPSNVDTVENVWTFMPEPGVWTIEVIGDEVNADTHSETGAVDADYALVVFSGVGG